MGVFEFTATQKRTDNVPPLTPPSLIFALAIAPKKIPSTCAPVQGEDVRWYYVMVILLIGSCFLQEGLKVCFFTHNIFQEEQTPTDDLSGFFPRK